MAILRRLRNYCRRPWSERRMLVSAWFLLGISRLAIIMLPFRTLVKWLGEREVESPESLGEAQLEITRGVRRAVQRASGLTPWTSNCFPQAMAAQYLLRRRGVATTLYFGCCFEDNSEMAAHAWLRSGSYIVTGRNGHRKYGVVARFATNAGRQ